MEKVKIYSRLKMISKKKTTKDLLQRFLDQAQGAKMEDLASTQELKKVATMNQASESSELQPFKDKEAKAA